MYLSHVGIINIESNKDIFNMLWVIMTINLSEIF